MHEKVARALSLGDLKQEIVGKEGTTGADVVGAMASATRLGSLLWRVLLAHDKTCVKPLEIMLAHQIRRPGENFNQVRRVAAIAVREYVDQRCRPCGGRGSLADRFNSVMKTCHYCGGFGTSRTDDARRATLLGCTTHAYQQKWRERFDQARNVLQRHHASTGERMRNELRSGGLEV